MAYSGTKTPNRFLTNNFQLEQVIRYTEQSQLRDWQLQYIKSTDRVVFDSKNCVFCANPTMNFRSYYNYMVMLNQVYDYWTNYGLFDQGYKPLIYLPSFWNVSSVSDTLIQMATVAGVNLHRSNGISLMYGTKAPGPAEYWVYKDELVKLISFAEEQFADRFGIEPKGKFDFGTRDPDKVRPTQLIKVYANMEEISKGGTL